MKSIIGAMALFLAVPAFAQTAPAADPHAGHSMPADHQDHHKMKHDCKACCEKMKKADGSMECMDGKKPAAGDDAKASDHSAHSGHDQ